MNKNLFIIAFIIASLSSTARAQYIPADSVEHVKKELLIKKNNLLERYSNSSENKIALLERMLDLGMWGEALKGINSLNKESFEYQILFANYLILNNDLNEAENLINQALSKEKDNIQAIYLKSVLEMHAWRLGNASIILEKALEKNYSEKLYLMLGRIRLLEKRYPEALEIAQKTIQRNPQSAGAYLLEADAYFWNQQPDLALSPLKKSLAIDPFNADARFSYGYAIWRKIDARLLNDMAKQWDIALLINPLHYQTHWHWGNGHTNLTYADYAEKDDDQIRIELEKGDDFVKKNKISEAIEHINSVKKKYPNSILPDLHKASIYYVAYDLDRKTRLDSAEHIFRRILSQKKHYGPAHNGLSAVIKSKRITFLSSYDSISNQLNNTKINDLENFKTVFPDIDYYPGNAVKAMAWNQLYSSVVYFPFLSKQNNSFRIPPLHKDLAITMNAPYFRILTTFDNRQWMDIRGVGSGAAAIEYVERGAFLERNVILHEYVHLFHGRVLSDEENRKIRSLYYKAMQEKRTLDYYSQNNESEYFAQTYPAYFEAVKVHPLDFKSMNTRSDLMHKDPEMFQFLDQLVKKEQAYLAGDKKAMARNWSQVYINLSNAAKQKNKVLAHAYLDTALNYDANYLPAILAKASLNIDSGNFNEAENWLSNAKLIKPNYAPTYVVEARISAQKLKNGLISKQISLKEQAENLKKAYRMEDDYQELAGVNRELREFYKNQGQILEAIQIADNYSKNASTISTYLRDQRNDAIAFSTNLRSALGDKNAVKTLKELVEQKPQNYEYRNLYADALMDHQEYEIALITIKESQRIVKASGNARSDFSLRIAEIYQELAQADSVDKYLKEVKINSLNDNDKLRLCLLHISKNKNPDAESILKNINVKDNPYLNAQFNYSKALIEASNSENTEAIKYLNEAINLNPFYLKAMQKLIQLYEQKGSKEKVQILNSKLIEIKNMRI